VNLGRSPSLYSRVYSALRNLISFGRWGWNGFDTRTRFQQYDHSYIFSAPLSLTPYPFHTRMAMTLSSGILRRQTFLSPWFTTAIITLVFRIRTLTVLYDDYVMHPSTYITFFFCPGHRHRDDDFLILCMYVYYRWINGALGYVTVNLSTSKQMFCHGIAILGPGDTNAMHTVFPRLRTSGVMVPRSLPSESSTLLGCSSLWYRS
jgi:hypothetical protein